MILTIALTLILCIIGATYLLLKQYYTRSDEPPVIPGAWPFVGHGLSFVTPNIDFWDSLRYYADMTTTLGGVAIVQLGPKRAYVVSDPDDMLTVANTCLQKDSMYDFTTPWVGEGLFTAKVPKWKIHRKLLSPSFSQVTLDSFMGIFNSQARKMVKDLDKEAGNGFFNHWQYTRSSALETTCLTALGVDFTDSLEKKELILETVDNIWHSVLERFVKFWWQSPYTFRFSILKKEQDGWCKIMHKLSDKVLQKRKADLGSNACAQRGTTQGNRVKTVMDLLLELSLEKNVLGDEEIRAHVDTTIAGGLDTTAYALMYTMLLLGAHPDVQEKVFTEIKRVLDDEGNDVTKQDLSQLVYLEAVIKESLRFHDIAPIALRMIDTDVKLKNYTLVAGHTCILALCGVHRHPIWGSDRNEFSPERWLDPSRLPENPNAFASFSLGRRMCIAKTYALMSMKTTLAHLVRHYRITAGDAPLKLKYEIFLKPVSGHFISIERRT